MPSPFLLLIVVVACAGGTFATLDTRRSWKENRESACWIRDAGILGDRPPKAEKDLGPATVQATQAKNSADPKTNSRLRDLPQDRHVHRRRSGAVHLQVGGNETREGR